MKVLVAEDDPDQLELRALLLARSGFETIPARDAAAALRAAAAKKPDCAVIDLRFPAEEQGLGLIRELKRLDAAMRIIVLTGASAGHLEKLPEKAMVDEVLMKGSCSSRLIEVIRAWQQAADCARARNQS
ncbi:MAG TPA: response regulator [Bryobacteraceae bacterium]|jgi:DNA-binding response OmpR family regulator